MYAFLFFEDAPDGLEEDKKPLKTKTIPVASAENAVHRINEFSAQVGSTENSNHKLNLILVASMLIYLIFLLILRCISDFRLP